MKYRPLAREHRETGAGRTRHPRTETPTSVLRSTFGINLVRQAGTARVNSDSNRRQCHCSVNEAAFRKCPGRTTRHNESMTQFLTPDRAFFARDALRVAPQLLGAHFTSVVNGAEVTIRITEVEAYHGLGTGEIHDPGSHARMGRTPRNSVMFGVPGSLYVYQSYGIHSAVNLVCSPQGQPSAVLLRAGEVIAGRNIAQDRRLAGASFRDLARGPGRLAQALGLLHSAHNGADALGGGVASIRIDPEFCEQHPERAHHPHIKTGPRVGVSGIGGSDAFPWRFWIDGDPTVSPYRPGKNVP